MFFHSNHGSASRFVGWWKVIGKKLLPLHYEPIQTFQPAAQMRLRFFLKAIIISISFLALPQLLWSSTRVSVLTVAPGREVFQLEGHTALRIVERDSVGSPLRDMVVNWGVFDFQSPNFIARFVKGDTDYMALAYPTKLFIEEYKAEGRKVIEQVINLSPERTDSLIDAIALNLNPENRIYRYNYVLDNCATRPMNLIQRYANLSSTNALGNTDVALSETKNRTFRSEMRRYHSNYPWYQFGIDLALGNEIDKPISERQQNFAPLQFSMALAKAQTADGAPLVNETKVLVRGPEEGVSQGATPWPLTPMAVSIYALIFTLAITYRDIKHCCLSKWFDSALFGLLGLLGCLLTFLIFFSSHYGASPNLLYLWLNPLCLTAAVGVWIKSWNRVVYWWQIINFAAVIMLFAAYAAGMQSLNPAFIGWMLCDLVRSGWYITRCNSVRNEK